MPLRQLKRSEEQGCPVKLIVCIGGFACSPSSRNFLSRRRAEHEQQSGNTLYFTIAKNTEEQLCRLRNYAQSFIRIIRHCATSGRHAWRPSEGFSRCNDGVLTHELEGDWDEYAKANKKLMKTSKSTGERWV
ncbi:hypothetical protein BKA67DRAFT_550746 [Truncatella angustata]|uniref:Uncharacterized protein n=1 Tax=Truncatella angustata TaxID=152316 RepID=A0A9P9A4L9_9PEZI|nr:uncharacterized protein BKA67DRAFT_550746 [Truncatella angustata]KAH6661293.1 hypothetical protein BKA67DRAFT_550746 [Truncatella angustata]